jgi:tRNA G18 (ribose-2'-O)-methylase SpoU
MIGIVAEVIEIDDPADPRVADYVGVTDAALRGRTHGGIFLIEGELVLRRALAAGTPLRSVLVTPPRLATLADDLAGLDRPVYLATQPVMDAVAGFAIHRGVLAAADRPALPSVEDVLTGAERVAVVEGMVDHENLGALFRNAAAFGVDAVLLDPRCADPLYRRCVRVSMGYVLTVPWARTGPWPDGLSALARAGFTTVALTPRTTAEPLGDWSPAAGERVALLVGSEGPGLTDDALDAADRRVRIPMATGVDSLNVATAAAIAFHHLRAARR